VKGRRTMRRVGKKRVARVGRLMGLVRRREG
jgi:hypothetical protein